MTMRVPKYLKDHPAVDYVEYMLDQSDGDYRWGVYLKEGWVFKYGRGMGTNYLNIQNRASFKDACPVPIDQYET